ncbi:HAD-IB family phosphatase [Emticicia sp. C21]|uniref:HAD-IB family phosphatase n=1 Tax=Emticicia sp. C21 TaxID=2302915 RepID=UPI000E34BC16|nr:HAD-IB family phosphatase [Emticicia sp. C21]RFS15543.1 glycosyltransferase [Emticicia sp. C21]
MITVVIPALNEEKTIGCVIDIAKNNPQVTEILVVDDQSKDNTVAVAKKHGAKVIISNKQGKGTSMRDGALYAKNEIIAFLDADITTYPANVVELLCKPLLSNEADFVKSYFTRQAGRVTELVAKPLLSILYPKFPTFRQPLSGMIAGKRSLLMKVDFEEGYGVDIGLLIDMYHLKARIVEVNIGHIENRMQSILQLGKMSRQVASVILSKSRFKGAHDLKTYEDIQVINQQMDIAIHENLQNLQKIAIFDMDNTITRKSFIHTAAREFDFVPELNEIVRRQKNPVTRTKQIATLLKGKSLEELLKVADSIPLTPNIYQLVDTLKERGFIIGIISDSYDCITRNLKNKLGLDFALSNELEFSNGIATGEVKIPSYFFPDRHTTCTHEFCKTHALTYICQHYSINPADTIMIGDGENDVCVIEKAGVGISFCATCEKIDRVADYVVKEYDFGQVAELIA